MNDAGEQACEMVQSITVQGQAAPIAQVAIGARDEGDYRLVVQLPINVWLPADVTLSAGAESVTAEFKRCFPQFCLAETEISDAMLAHLSSQSEPGAVAFQDAGQRDVSVPLSFNGLADASAALTADSESEETSQ
jgi:invasion protein IalB